MKPSQAISHVNVDLECNITLHSVGKLWHPFSTATAQATRPYITLCLVSFSLMQPSPSWEAANCTPTQGLSSILWNRRFITFHLSLSWGRSIQSIPCDPIFLRSILILFTHLRLGLPSGLFLLAFSPISYMHSSPHSYFMSCPSHSPWLDHSNYTWRRVQVMKQFSPTSCHFIPLWANILLSTLFSNTLSLCSSLDVRDQVSHPYRTTGEVSSAYSNFYVFRQQTLLRLWTETERLTRLDDRQSEFEFR
jgi:hypothetical protein